MKIDISIIIPVFNTDQYLEECLNSILNQSFHSFEIIIINDKSTDSSKKIINDYLKKDSRIKLIDNVENLGVAKSRNKGLKIALGNYIYVMDSDDFMVPNALNIMFNCINNTDSEVLLLDAYKYNDARNIEYFNNPIRGNNIEDLLGHAAWFIFIKKEVLERSNDITFTSNAHPHEDTAFTFKVFCFANKICRLKKPIIYWRQHSCQVTRTQGIKRYRKYLNSAILVDRDLRFFLKKNKNKINFKKRMHVFKNIPFNVHFLGIYNFISFIYFLKKGIFLKLKRFFYQKKITSSNAMVITIFKIIIYYKKNYYIYDNKNIIISND